MTPDNLALRLPDPGVPEADPFRQDLFQRKGSAAVLTGLVRETRGPAVIAIDSPWGTGKSTFLRMWTQELKNAGVSVISFNAWENDFADDPFIALAGEITSAMEMMHPDAGAAQDIRKTREIASDVATLVMPVLVKLASSTNPERTSRGSQDPLRGDLGNRLQQYERAKATLHAFRQALEKAVVSIDNPTMGPLVFCIDELDRCRPSFAVALLEKLKHLFNVEGVVFVLAWDKTQLMSSIRSVYGAELDAIGYLRRFLDFEYTLPEPTYEMYATHLVKELGIEKNLRSRQREAVDGDLPDILTGLFDAFSLSAREQIHVASRILLAMRTFPANEYTFVDELAILALLREWRPVLYRAIRQGGKWHDQVVTELTSSVRGDAFMSLPPGRVVRAVLASGAAELGDSGPVAAYEKVQNESSLRGSVAQETLSVIRSFSGSGRRVPRFSETLKRLRMNERFVSLDTPTK